MRDSEVWICGRRWKFLWHQHTAGTHGYTDKSEQTIIANANDRDKFAVAVHEVIHATQKSVLNGHPEDEELCTQALETGIVSILRDPRNKKFVAMLVALL